MNPNTQVSTAKHKKTRRARPTMSEARLRKIVRDELSRQVLLDEGLSDTIKKPFSKLKDNAKEWVLKRSEEITKKASEVASKIQVPQDMKDFIDAIPKVEGGVSKEELIAMVPGLADNAATLDKLKNTDLLSMISPSAKNESVDFYDVKLSYALSEEKYRQKIHRHQDFLLKESVVLSALAVWYAFAKTVVTTVGLLVFLLEAATKVSDLLGLDKARDVFKKLAHFFEKIEDWFLAKAVFPPPVQYAAYLALSGVKKVAGKEDKVLSFKEFNSPENKETKEKVIKGLKIALLCVVVAEALLHMAHAIEKLFEHVFKTTQDLAHGAAHAGIETKNVARIGGELAKAGTETAKSAKTMAGVAGSVEPG